MKNSLKQKLREEKARCKSKWVFKGRMFAVRSDLLEFDDEPPHDWNIVVHVGAVAVLPITKSGGILFVEQWRRAVGVVTLELPAGVPEEGEEWEVAAQREMQEEVGYRAEELSSLGKILTSPGFCNEVIHLFVGRKLIQSSLPQDAHEGIDVVELSLKQALEAIDSGRITDAKTICGLYKYARQIKEI